MGPVDQARRQRRLAGPVAGGGGWLVVERKRARRTPLRPSATGCGTSLTVLSSFSGPGSFVLILQTPVSRLTVLSLIILIVVKPICRCSVKCASLGFVYPPSLRKAG